VERVETHHSVRCADSNDTTDPFGAVSGDEAQCSGQFGAQLVEELVDGLLGASLVLPDHLSGEVITHHRQILVAFLVQVRIHPDNTDADGVGELTDIATIDRDGPLTSSTIAMSIEEAKQILAGIDDVVVVTCQTGRAIAAANDCAGVAGGSRRKTPERL